MSEENLTPDFDGLKNENEPAVEPTNEDEPPRKRIIRRKLVNRIKPTVFKEEEKSEIKNEGKKEISTVLENLYGDEGSRNDIQEITMKETSLFSKIFSLLGVAAVFAGVIWAGLFFLPKTSGSDSQISLSISGPNELALGATSTYTIYYENKSSSALNKVVLNAYYPEGFVFVSSDPSANNPGHNEWQISSLDPYERGSISVTGLTYGSVNEQKSWRVFLNYSPENFNSELQKAATLNTVISTSPVKLTISGPDKASVGQDVTYSFSVQKNLAWKGQVFVVPTVPDNFSITSSSPALDKKTNQWPVGAAGTSTKTYKLTGKYVAVKEASSEVSGNVILQYAGGTTFEIADAKLTTELLKSEVSVSLAVNGTITDFDSKPGDLLNITLRVRNDSTKEITDVIPKITFSAPSSKKVSLLKFSDLVDKNENTLVGEQIDDNTRRGILSWNKSQLEALASIKPNSEVTIDIQLPIKNASEFDLTTIKNALLTIVAEAKFKDLNKATQTVVTKPLNLTLNSDLSFNTDDSVVGQGGDGEKHTVSWVLKNNFHKLKDVKVVATVFGDVKFSLLDKAAGDLNFDQDNMTVTWLIPEMPEETDVLNCSFTLDLLKRNPTQSLLLSKAHLTATDTVTGKTIDLAGEEISMLNQP